MQEFLASLKCTENNNHLKKLELGFDSPSYFFTIYSPLHSYIAKSLTSKNCLWSYSLLSPPISYSISKISLPLIFNYKRTFLYSKISLITLFRLHIQDTQVKNLTACIAKDLAKLESLNIYFFLYPFLERIFSLTL